MTGTPNQAPSPTHLLQFPLGAFGSFVYLFRVPPAARTAVGEARRWADPTGQTHTEKTEATDASVR